MIQHPSRLPLFVIAASLLWLGGLVGCGDDDTGDNNNNSNNQNPTLCGDGHLDPGEQCDEGAANSDLDPDACRSDCRRARCGDGVLDTDEVCDEGAANSNLVPGACRTDCSLPTCGDGALDPWEQCDLGDTQPGDGCDAQCQVEPHFTCDAQGCVCQDYYQGDRCLTCVVRVDLEATGEPVDGLTWDTAYRRLQPAIDRAASLGGACEIWVAEGTYYIYEYGPLNTVTLHTGVGVYGGFTGTETERSQRDPATHRTILSADNDADGEYQVQHVLTALDTNDATLDGLEVTGGDTAMPDPNPNPSFNTKGAGLRMVGSSLVINSCHFSSNRSWEQGGAIAAEGSRLVIHHGTFIDNQGEGSGVYAYLSEVTVQDSRFVDNSGSAIRLYYSDGIIERVLLSRNHQVGGAGAAAIDADHSDLVVRDCALSNNLAMSTGGGIRIEYCSSAVVERTWFVQNQASVYPGQAHGGAVYQAGTAVDYRDCVFWNNGASDNGGAVFATGQADVTFTNCTLVDNSADSGAVVFATTTADSITVRNSIVYGNTAIGDSWFARDNPTGTPLTITYSLVEGQSGGTGNITGAPGFATPPTGSGTWTGYSYDEHTGETTLEDTTQSWTPGALRNRLITVDSARDYMRYLVLDNTATTITVLGDVTGDVEYGDGSGYSFLEPRLAATSNCVDAGDDSVASTADIDGLPRADGDGNGSVLPDIGACELQ